MPETLDLVAREIRRCKLCPLCHTRRNAVPGEGPSSTKCMCIGESPGTEEDKTGRPFVGRSGRLLDSVLEMSELKRENLFITGSLKCHPPHNREPRADELSACRPYLLRQIDIIRPRIIVLLGRIAIKGFMGDVALEQVRGRVFARPGGIMLPTYHPAAAMRFPARRGPFIKDIATLSSLLRE